MSPAKRVRIIHLCLAGLWIAITILRLFGLAMGLPALDSMALAFAFMALAFSRGPR